MSTPKLVVIEGKLKGRVFDVTGTLVVGRLASAQIQLDDVKVSREHSKIFMQGADMVIVDLNSRNGTLVNDSKVTKRTLHHGDEILIGETRFRYDSGSAPATAPAPAAPPKKEPVKKEVVDLTVKPAAPAASDAVRGDQIVIKERALQFSRNKDKKGGGFLFGDLSQRSVGFQVLMAVIVIAACVLFVVIGIQVAGAIRGGG